MENDNLTNALNSSGITQSGKLSTEGPREIGGHQESKENDDLVVERQEKRLARTIVTPSRTVALTANVTFRAKEIAQSLSLSPKTSYLNEDALVIGALSDMEIADKHDDEMMEGEVQNDDLLGIDLMEIEAGHVSSNIVESSRHPGDTSYGRSKSKKNGTKMCVPLGIQSKKTRFLRRGSPSARSNRHSRPSHHESSRKPREILTKGDGSSKGVGLMGPKYPSKHHP